MQSSTANSTLRTRSLIHQFTVDLQHLSSKQLETSCGISEESAFRRTNSALLNRTLPATGGQSFVAINDDEGGYFALAEVFHQLHYLNLIRQYTWRDWYLRHEDIVPLPGDLANGPVEARMHANHCIETLRLSLMCHADTTPMFIMDDPSVPTGTKADFNVHHKCADLEALRRWMKVNSVSAHRW